MAIIFCISCTVIAKIIMSSAYINEFTQTRFMKHPNLHLSSMINKSLTKKENRIGLSIPPCFTPAANLTELGKKPSQEISVQFFEYQFYSKIIILIGMLVFKSFTNRP